MLNDGLLSGPQPSFAELMVICRTIQDRVHLEYHKAR
jgi:hypothetical protein